MTFVENGGTTVAQLKDNFMKAIAVKSAEYLVDQEVGELSGPFMDIILSLRHKLPVELLDLWKEVRTYYRRRTFLWD